MTFKVDYFDGITSRKHNATVSINSLNWNISYLDLQSKRITRVWDLKLIVKSNVYTKGWVVFNYGEDVPFQKIESSDNNFIKYLKNNHPAKLNNSLDVLLHKSKIRSLIVLILTVLGLAFITYIYIIPAVAVKFVSSLSDKNTISFGDYIFNAVTVDFNIDDKQTKNAQVFVDEMEFDNSFPIKIYIVKSNTLNAFALSGGKIIIFSGLLEKLDNENQLVALIGHEVAHIENRHILKNMATDLAGKLFVSILIGDVNGISSILIENAHLVTQLSYSRELEKEADIYGLEVMKMNGVDLIGMSELFTILKNEQSIEISKYISNHPNLDERINYTKKIGDKSQFNNENIVLKDRWKTIKSVFK